MKIVKNVVCGNTQQEISADTKIEIGLANKQECEEFEKAHWNWPADLPITPAVVDTWKSFCDLLTNMDTFWGDERKLWEECLRSLGDNTIDQYDGLRRCEFRFVQDDTSGKGMTIQIDATYSRRVKKHKANGDWEWGYEDVTTCPITNAVYPLGFKTILLVLDKYLTEKTKPRKSVFSKKEKPAKLSTYSEKIQTFFKSNEWYINRFKEYSTAWNRIIEGKDYQQFVQSKQRVLRVDDKVYFANYCGFDIDKKFADTQQVISKISNSNDSGEEKVEYAIKWCLAEFDQHVVEIEKNCESKYRYNCIMLNKPDFIDEPQEYDHILVSNAGIVLIETKHWRGRVEIRPDGKWLRDADNDGHVIGVENPAFQMQRHEMLIKSILPNVPVFGLLCFSNTSAVLDGQENFKEYPIVYADQLKAALTKILMSGTTSDSAVTYIVEEIEKHKINKIHSSQDQA